MATAPVFGRTLFLLEFPGLMKSKAGWAAGSLMILLAIALLALPIAVRGQIPPPQYAKHSLLNGFEVLLLDEPAPRPRFALMIRNGAAFDPAGKWGATFLMCRMMMERTEKRTGEQLRQDLRTIGADLFVRADWDAIFFYGSAPSERLEDALNILSEMVVRPEFDEETFERLRNGLIAEVKGEADNLELQTQKVLLNSLFQQNPYAHGVKGELETLNNLNVNDVKIQYRKLIMPNQAQLALYFSGDQAGFLRSLGRRWGSWVSGEPLPFTFRQATPPTETSIAVWDRPGQDCLIRVGALGPRRGEPDYYALKTLEQYLTLSLSHWASEVANESQIQASVHVKGLQMPGFVELNLRTESDRTVPYLRRIWGALADLRAGKIDPARFKEAKELAFLDLRNRLSDPEGRLFELLEANLYDLGISYLTTYGLRLDRVSPDKLQAVVQSRLPETAFRIVVAGPVTKLEAGLRSLGRLDILN